MQNEPPPLPEMKPIETPAQEKTERVPSTPRSQEAPGVPLGKRLRQMVGMVAGGGLMVTVGLVGSELIAKPGLTPTDMLATFEARTELGIMNQKLGVEPGKLVLDEAEYRERLAEAERKGQASAELELQKQIAVVQADKERVVQAYATLYQRANLIAQAAIQLETLAQQFRQQLLQMSNGGRSMVIMMKDLFCGFSGDPATCESARADRRVMIDEADELSRGDVGNRVRELMAGVDDPASGRLWWISSPATLKAAMSFPAREAFARCGGPEAAVGSAAARG